jgi:hypothetical protein
MAMQDLRVQLDQSLSAFVGLERIPIDLICHSVPNASPGNDSFGVKTERQWNTERPIETDAKSAGPEAPRDLRVRLCLSPDE